MHSSRPRSSGCRELWRRREGRREEREGRREGRREERRGAEGIGCRKSR